MFEAIVQFSSVAQSCLTLCNPIDCSTPGLPVHHQLHGHEFEQAPGDSGQGGLACCSQWGRKESDVTERLNNNNILTGNAARKKKAIPAMIVYGKTEG